MREEEQERIRRLENFGRAEGGGNFVGGVNIGNFWGSPRAPRIPNVPIPNMEEQMDVVKRPGKD